MPIIRNPFRKQDENVRPTVVTDVEKPNGTAKPVDIKEPTEYKLSGECAHHDTLMRRRRLEEYPR